MKRRTASMILSVFLLVSSLAFLGCPPSADGDPAVSTPTPEPNPIAEPTPTPDAAPPSEAASIVIEADDASLSFRWEDPPEADFDHVIVSASGGAAGPWTVAAGAETLAIHGLDNGTEYSFIIKTADASGNASSGLAVTGTPLAPGAVEGFSCSGVDFEFAYMPRRSFPTGFNNAGNAQAAPFWVARTEVTWELWSAVYQWATDPERGESRYFFNNAGVMGGGTGSLDPSHPATTMNWHAAMVWCNAATEWYNALTGASLQAAYLVDGVTVRDARDVNGANCRDAQLRHGADGFRLLTVEELECAGRFLGEIDPGYGIEYPPDSGRFWTPGNYASGAAGPYTDDAANDAVCVWQKTLDTSVDPPVYVDTLSTSPVASKAANALGVFDMSGNVAEWSFSAMDSSRYYNGGYWLYYGNVYELQVGIHSNASTFSANDGFGLRIGRTAR